MELYTGLLNVSYSCRPQLTKRTKTMINTGIKYFFVTNRHPYKLLV